MLIPLPNNACDTWITDDEQTVIPGFEYSDHDFLKEGTFEEIVTKEQADELRWLIRKE